MTTTQPKDRFVAFLNALEDEYAPLVRRCAHSVLVLGLRQIIVIIVIVVIPNTCAALSVLLASIPCHYDQAMNQAIKQAIDESVSQSLTRANACLSCTRYQMS
jgi:hypothetical protein